MCVYSFKSNIYVKTLFSNFSYLFEKYKECQKPSSDLPNGNYIDLDDNERYTSGETIKFKCDDGTRIYPQDGQIECSTVGWLQNATCAKS